MQRHSPTPEVRAVTRGPRHHWFGYYDKTPWDVAGRHMLALEAGFMDRPPGPDDVATIGLIDTADGDAWQPIAGTTAWSWPGISAATSIRAGAVMAPRSASTARTKAHGRCTSWTSAP
ncbi:MAG: hypothetical protein KAX19_13615 [Candidatus Brocadiae bacterium]|nr:hypothetical protein [Candidatus Brocadiia bacterium]